ncbi:MAG: cryptochrome/photolyase family protein [Anaerolineales bacterium]|jgi:deoxyribodipyrimidine photolyase-related protein
MTISVWILGDQLLLNHPALKLAETHIDKEYVVVLMVESEARARRYPYQRKKLVLLLSAMRHYAQRLRALGYQVDYRISKTTSIALKEHIQSHQTKAVYLMAASEFRGRKYQDNIASLLNIPVTVLPNTQFLTGRFDPFPDPKPGKHYIQEQFYRRMRQHFDLLMDPNDKPIGGKWNFDKSNRHSLPKDAQPPAPISFKPDEITKQVMQEIDRKYQGVGQVTGFDLAVTHEYARLAAEDFFDHRLPDFGAYEDAMSSAYGTIYHSRLSPYLNIGLLEPLNLAKEAQKRYVAGQAPINSVEGFIRQVIGWREYIYWQYWYLMPKISGSNYWNFTRSLPKMFWEGDTKLNCLHQVINRALQSGYTHHIERLMIVSNFCLLIGVDPNAVNEWFLSTYIDAYEWVMIPNVFGMGLFADGGLIATKPYIASANYIHKMSDYCHNCIFNHKLRTGEDACPFNFLYWNFLLQNEGALRSIPRMARSLLGLRHLDREQRRLVQESAAQFLEGLQ